MTESEPASAWLPTWMARQIEIGATQRAAVSPVKGDAIYLCATWASRPR